MPLPALLGGLGRMGLGIATSTLGGLGMGFGYGYGVRAGYNSYKPNQNKQINKQILSMNPVEAGMGMGRDSASKQFSMTSEPSITSESSKLVESSPQTKTQFKRVPAKDLFGRESSKIIKLTEVPDAAPKKHYGPDYVSTPNGMYVRKKSSFKSYEDYQNFIKHGILPKT